MIALVDTCSFMFLHDCSRISPALNSQCRLNGPLRCWLCALPLQMLACISLGRQAASICCRRLLSPVPAGTAAPLSRVSPQLPQLIPARNVVSRCCAVQPVLSCPCHRSDASPSSLRTMSKRKESRVAARGSRKSRQVSCPSAYNARNAPPFRDCVSTPYCMPPPTYQYLPVRRC